MAAAAHRRAAARPLLRRLGRQPSRSRSSTSRGPRRAAAPVTLGDAVRGQAIFKQTCGGCHGMNAEGGVGPRLAGAQITVAAAKTQIDNGGGIMPAKLVSGSREDDVLAYLATIFAK